MKYLRPVFGVLLALFLVGLIGYASWWLVSRVLHALSGANPTVVAACIAGATTILGSIVALTVGQFISRAREAAEAHRPKKVEIYSEFISTMTGVLRRTAEDSSYNLVEDRELLERLSKYQADILLWASPRVVRCWLNFRNVSAMAGTDSILRMDEFIKAIRDDLGLSNRRLAKGDLIKILLRDPEEVDALIAKRS